MGGIGSSRLTFAAPFDMWLAAASKHIRTLERAGLLKRTVLGRIHDCRLDPEPLAAADEWLRDYERLWDIRPHSEERPSGKHLAPGSGAP